MRFYNASKRVTDIEFNVSENEILVLSLLVPYISPVESQSLG